MAAARNGHHGGVENGVMAALPVSRRFADIPTAIEVPVGDLEDEAVEIDLQNLMEDPTELCSMLENEGAARTFWMTVALAYAKQRKIDNAIDILIHGGSALQGTNPKEKLSIVSCLCWLYLWKSRNAPRLAPEAATDTKTKEHYLGLATTTLNEASRINPAFPPLFLARGVLYLQRASLQPPNKSATPGAVEQEKSDLLRQALRSFEDAIRVSQGKNMLALMGKARALFSMGKYAESLSAYQDVLQRTPDLVDPDPRIGIGCCLWQLGFKDDASAAWTRSLEINPDSKIANILLGLYHLEASGQVAMNSPEFVRHYKKAMTEFTQKAFKIDKNSPLTCATFAGYFLSRPGMPNVDVLARKAIDYTEINAIASDGWYLLGRRAHQLDDVERASDFYRRADDARGGIERGYLPAKFGAAQLSVVKQDLGEAKLRLEKIIQQSKSYEAQTLLGTIYAEEVFANQFAAVKEDKSAEERKAISALEAVRAGWKDTRKGYAIDPSVLANLARLYEAEHPEKALQCLLDAEQFEIDQIPASKHPQGIEDPAELRAALRKLLPPQLLNNIGCFYFQANKLELAGEMFQAALNSCMRINDEGEEVDTDALVTTISFNLGRCYESRGMVDEALEVYEGLLARHDDYIDAKTRVAYIKLRKFPNKEGPEAVQKLYEDNRTDLEVRSLYGWYLGRISSRKRPSNVQEDPELRHHKHTLQNHDKHDRYALVAMGNSYLTSAREMRRETDQDKQKRSATYSRAVEFFDKALQLDPKNAYAAMGYAVALAEDQKDYTNALAILVGIKETLKDAHVYVNLGHIYAELKQFSKAIECYETALSKDGKGNDTNILACLGRTWLNKARSEKDLDSYRKALAYAQKTLSISPDQVHFKFNVAFVQIQLASAIKDMRESERKLEQLEAAAKGLQEAIEALTAIAAGPQPPYPKQDLEQRANMAKNTQRRQLERAIESQREWEERNAERLKAAKEQREADIRRREKEKHAALERDRERQERLAKEREEIAARDLENALKRAAEERAAKARAAFDDSDASGDGAGAEGGASRPKKKRRPAGEGGGGAKSRPKKKKVRTDEEDSDADEGERQPKKKRKLASAKENSKYKSAEIIVDSDEDDDDAETAAAASARKASGGEGGAGGRRRSTRRQAPSSDGGGDGSDAGDRMDVDSAPASAAESEDDEDEPAVRVRRPAAGRARRGKVVEESDEEEEEDEGRGDGEEISSPPAQDDSDDE